MENFAAWCLQDSYTGRPVFYARFFLFYAA